MTEDRKTGLARLREPFPENQISKLPKPTKSQTEAVRADYKKGIRCALCGQWHHPDVVHLDYVGHAAITDRLLECDPEWNWEPVAQDDRGLPVLDQSGGMWIKLTVCGVTRLGYGAAEGKQGGNAVKERIGDALRNAGMRFGAALDLWHKGELHLDSAQNEGGAPKQEQKPAKPQAPSDQAISEAMKYLSAAESLDDLKSRWSNVPDDIRAVKKVIDEKDSAKERLTPTDNADLGGDELPY